MRLPGVPNGGQLVAISPPSGPSIGPLRDRDRSVEVWPPYPNYVIDLEYTFPTRTANRKKQQGTVCGGFPVPKRGISGPEVGFGIRLALAIGVSLTTFRRHQMRGLGRKPQKLFLVQGGRTMMNRLMKVLSTLHREESGQDLIEYALLAALIALAATAGMSVVASDINNAFVKIGSKLSANVGT